jgi:hypothetical protein
MYIPSSYIEANTSDYSRTEYIMNTPIMAVFSLP